MESISGGEFARLPDGTRIIVKEVDPDGYASALRVEGEYQGMLVVCAISKLQPDTESYAPSSSVI